MLEFDVISSPVLFFAIRGLELMIESKSILLIIWIVLLVSRTFMVSFCVSSTIPTMFFVVFIKSSFLRLWTFYSQIISPLYNSRLFLLIVMELPFYVKIWTSFGSTSKIKPAFPESAPEITFTLCPFLNLLAKCSRGSSRSSPSKALFLHFMMATLSFISTMFP